MYSCLLDAEFLAMMLDYSGPYDGSWRASYHILQSEGCRPLVVVKLSSVRECEIRYQVGWHSAASK